MKLVFLAALLACASAMPRRMALPRLPISVMAKGKYQLNASSKVIGGSPVAPNSLPFQVSLQRNSGGVYIHSCGGSILDSNVIITGCYCVEGFDAATMRIVAGEHALSAVSGLEQNRDVVRYLMHENYDGVTSENDIALIFLAAPLDLTVSSAKPINLPAANSEPGPIVTVSGWGVTETVEISDVLLSLDLPVVSDADCDAAYGAGSVLPSMICAGDLVNGGIDSCDGDDGGPLFIGTGATAVQHGIVSWGNGCAMPGYPGVYTQVSYFLDWIAANRG